MLLSDQTNFNRAVYFNEYRFIRFLGSVGLTAILVLGIPQYCHGQWLSLHPGPSENYVRAVDVDEDGSIIVIGKIRHPVTLSQDVILSPRWNSCCTEVAMYGATFTKEGELLAAKIIADHSPNLGQTNYGQSSIPHVGDVVWLPSGDYMIAGYMASGSGSAYMTLGQRPNHIELAANNGAAKTFVARYNANHELVWAKELRYVSGGARAGYMRFARSPDGGIYVTGWPLLIKFKSNGEREWEFYHTLWDTPYSVAANKEQVCVADDADSGTRLTCLDHDGVKLSEITIREANRAARDVQLLDLEFTDDGLLFTGYVESDSIDYGNGVIAIEGDTEETERFVGAFDTDIQHIQWVRSIPTIRYHWQKSWNDKPRVVQCADGFVYVTGSFDRSWVNPVADSGSFTEHRAGSFYLKMTPLGEVIMAESIRWEMGDIWVNGMECIDHSDLVVVGEFKWEMNFNPPPREPYVRFSYGLTDGFLFRMSMSDIGFPVASEQIDVPTQTILAQISPNPANAFATIRVDSPSNEIIRIDIYDALARKVIGREFQPSSGNANVKWQLDTTALESGVYFIRLASGLQIITKSMVITH